MNETELSSKEVIEKFGEIKSELATHTEILRTIKADIKWIREKTDSNKDKLNQLEKKIAYLAGAGAVLIPIFSVLFHWIMK